MIIGDNTVVTPYENQIEYDADWRHQVAHGIAAFGSALSLSPEIEGDPYIQTHAEYLAKFNEYPTGAAREHPNHALTSKWYTRTDGGAAKFYFDALLLTSQPMEIVAADMGVDTETAKLYERLFFSCRQDDGNPVTGCYLRTHMAVGPLLEITAATPRQVGWRAIGLQAGYTALAYTWGWGKMAHGDLSSDVEMLRTAMQMAHGRIIDGILRGTIEMIDILGVIGNYINYERHLFDMGRSQTAEGAMQGLELLALIAPKMLSVAQAQDNGSGPQQKLLAESEIRKTDAGDKGLPEGLKQMDKDLARHFQAAKQEIERVT